MYVPEQIVLCGLGVFDGHSPHDFSSHVYISCGHQSVKRYVKCIGRAKFGRDYQAKICDNGARTGGPVN